ncbi:MAG: hypothetical protein HYZ93_02120 [Candidatus Omnitrophica bacterium]|nr:hypothetical protein [Candidatus Omnitrophota bacterium]
MRSIETTLTFSLSSVKPLEELESYRQRCLHLTREAIRKGCRHRADSPVSGLKLEPFGEVGGLPYGRCPTTGSLFLMEMPVPQEWARLLAEVVRLRHSPEVFHSHLAQSRMDHVYAPKLEWVEETLRLQQIREPRVLEAVTFSSDFTQLLKESGCFSEVVTEEETRLAGGSRSNESDPVHAAVLLESLDHSEDPKGLLEAVRGRLCKGGLLFVTALVASGFDICVLGLRNLYLVPPDRANCFTLQGLSQFLAQQGFALLEVSTPGVLDLEIVRAHWRQDSTLPLSDFERRIVTSDEAARRSFQSFLQQQRMSSFARIVARRDR